MKKIFIFVLLTILMSPLWAQSFQPIVLDPPDKDRGLSVMAALAKRGSVRDFDTTSIRHRDISDLLWAANGINRPDEGKRTAASALNAQDIDVYVALKHAVYLYDAHHHHLEPVVEGDHRQVIAGRQESVAEAPLILLLVSDISRFGRGDESQKLEWAAIDAGIVAQNVMLFCASEGFATVPRSFMDRQKLREILMLKDSQHIMLNIPVSNKKE
jgi:nitroreductase